MVTTQVLKQDLLQKVARLTNAQHIAELNLRLDGMLNEPSVDALLHMAAEGQARIEAGHYKTLEDLKSAFEGNKKKIRE
jgi:hypothetical protein